jgi:hypothetical protein
MTQSEDETARLAEANESLKKDQATAASMADIKALETTLTSSMDARFNEFRDLLNKLINNKPSDIIPLEKASNSDEGGPKEDKEQKEKEVKANDKPKSSPNLHEEKEEYHAVRGWYSPDPIITTRINPLGPPPKLNALAFASWQRSMKSHVNSASIELWRIIEEGYIVEDPSNMTKREFAEKQLNASALHMIELSLSDNDKHHVLHATTAKEAWDCLERAFLGNESMKRNRYESLSNAAEGFYMLDNETHEEMYGRLKTLAKAFYDVGATYVDDAWVKRKYENALLPSEPMELKSIQGRYNYLQLSSHEVMQEVQASKVATKNAEDNRARAMGMRQGPSLALKAKVTCLDANDEVEACPSNIAPHDLEQALNGHIALATRVFWNDPASAKARVDRDNNSSGKKELASRTKTCYNCHDKNHYIRECPYENREQNGGKLIPKDHSKLIQKKPARPRKPFFKKAPRIVLVAQEEYATSDSEDEDTPNKEVAALAIVSTSSSSLFESPNENLSINTARCLMAHVTEVSSPSPKTMHDQSSLEIKKELVAFDTFVTNLQGEAKEHVESLMRQLCAAEELLQEKSKIEREDSLTIASLNASIASLNSSLDEESEYRTTLEERLESLDAKNDEIISKIIKDRDHVFAKYKVIKKEKVELGVANTILLEDMEKLDKAHKVLKTTHSILVKSHEQLQTQLSKTCSTSITILPRVHENVIEENARLKVDHAKTSIPKGNDKGFAYLFELKPHKGKEGLGYVAEAKKKVSNTKENKTKPAQAKTNIASGNATRGKTTRSDFAGHNNPNYILYVDYYGDVYAKYVGPYDGYIDYSIWVPKTLVANRKGPIEKWVPKCKK